MKKVIKKILREQEEEIIQAPPFSFFRYDWQDVLDWADDRLFKMDDDLYLAESKITILGGLVEVNGSLNLRNSDNLQSLGKLKRVGGLLNLSQCINLKSLGELETVNNTLTLFECINLQSVGNLKTVGGSLDIRSCPNLESLGELEYIGYDLKMNFYTNNTLRNNDNLRKQINIRGFID